MIQGSKPLATYNIKQAGITEALKLRLQIEDEFKKSHLAWFQHYFITSAGDTVTIEIYTKEADEYLRGNIPQHLL
jgi:hypothetical protein